MTNGSPFLKNLLLGEVQARIYIEVMIFQKSILVSAVSSLFLSAETFAVNALDLAIVNGQAPSICTKIVEFSACTTEAATNQANCNNLVTDVPGFDYWVSVFIIQNISK